MPQIELPYKNPMNDGRRKIHPDKHDEVRRKYMQLKSLRKTADIYGVSKRLIHFIVRPEKYKRQLDNRKENQVHKKYAVSSRERAEIMRKFRKKKREHGLIESKKTL